MPHIYLENEELSINFVLFLTIEFDTCVCSPSTCTLTGKPKNVTLESMYIVAVNRPAPYKWQSVPRVLMCIVKTKWDVPSIIYVHWLGATKTQGKVSYLFSAGDRLGGVTLKL